MRSVRLIGVHQFSDEAECTNLARQRDLHIPLLYVPIMSVKWITIHKPNSDLSRSSHLPLQKKNVVDVFRLQYTVCFSVITSAARQKTKILIPIRLLILALHLCEISTRQTSEPLTQSVIIIYFSCCSPNKRFVVLILVVCITRQADSNSRTKIFMEKGQQKCRLVIHWYIWFHNRRTCSSVKQTLCRRHHLRLHSPI